MYKLFHGNCIDVMKLNMADNSVDLTVTSPPYDKLRTYEDELVWNEFIWKEIIKELYRVTKKGGVVVWVVNDATVNGSETGTSFKQALFAIECGFRLHDTMIYSKFNFSMPSTNRYHQTFEYMFIFSKGKPKTFNPIKDRKNKTKKALGKNSVRLPNGEMKSKQRKLYSEFGQRFNIWQMKTSGQENVCKAIKHPATFPKKLAHDQIISWSNEGDVIFDPFLGSGITGIEALKMYRDFIGIEVVSKYYRMAEESISKITINEKIDDIF